MDPAHWQPGHPHRLGDQLYALGGYDGGGQLSTVESLDTQTGLWRTEAPMLSKRGALAAVLVDGRIFAVGGNDGRRDLATVESFDSGSGSWRSEVPMPSKRRALTACVLDSRFYALGGTVRDRGSRPLLCVCARARVRVRVRACLCTRTHMYMYLQDTMARAG